MIGSGFVPYLPSNSQITYCFTLIGHSAKMYRVIGKTPEFYFLTEALFLAPDD